MKISKTETEPRIWRIIEKFANGWDELETGELGPSDRTELLRALNENEAGELARTIAAEASAEKRDGPSMQSLFSGLQIEPQIRRPDLPSGARYREPEKEYEGPTSKKLRQIWELSYGKQAKSYAGQARDVRSQLVADPAVLAIFQNPDVFLALIGWNTMETPHPRQEGGVTLSVELSFFGDTMFNVQANFPNGMQHTHFTFRISDADTVKIVSVYRHRSMKAERSPENFFVKMIAEQASGVALLGGDVDYHSTAIRNDGEGWGYNVWPKLGFDGEVPDDSLRAMMGGEEAGVAEGVAWLREFSRKGSVRFSDMFTVEESTLYEQLKTLWGKHGKTVHVQFDPSAESSWRTLRRYARSKNIALGNLRGTLQ